MHGLQAVAGVRQRARHDDAHGVREVRLLHLVVDVDRADQAVFGRGGFQAVAIISWFGCRLASGHVLSCIQCRVLWNKFSIGQILTDPA